MDTRDLRAASALDAYLSRLETRLAALPAAERREILLETRSHVLERTEREPSRPIADVLAELGTPERYATQFLPADHAAPAQRTTALGAIARLASGRWTSLPLLLLVVTAYSVAVLMLLLALWKLNLPAEVGLWIDHGEGGRRSFFFGATDGAPPPKGREVLGYWIVPMLLLLATTIHLIMSALLRRLLRADARASGHAADRKAEFR